LHGTEVRFSNKEFEWLVRRLHVVGSGSFRILVKVHKAPASSRQISSLRGAWLEPVAQWVSECLNNLVLELPGVLQSGDHCQDPLENMTFKQGTKMMTLDMVNLYPSIPRKFMMAVISKALRKTKSLAMASVLYSSV